MRRNSAFGEPLGDEELEVLIADSIGTHPMLCGARIAVEAHKRIVTLTGVVRTPLHRHLLDLLARKLGALGVDNRVRVESDPEVHDRSEEMAAD